MIKAGEWSNATQLSRTGRDGNDVVTPDLPEQRAAVEDDPLAAGTDFSLAALVRKWLTTSEAVERQARPEGDDSPLRPTWTPPPEDLHAVVIPSPDLDPGDLAGSMDPADPADPVDADPVDAHPVDAHPVDAHPVDAHPVDAVDAVDSADPADPADSPAPVATPTEAPAVPELPRRRPQQQAQLTRRLAVLIHAGTTTAESAEALFEALAEQGTISVCRAYADWTSPEARGWWSAPLRQHGIQPYHQFGDGQDQRSLVALSIDAVDLARDGAVDAVVIVGDLVSLQPLVVRLNAAGLQVLAFGTTSTPDDVQALCHEFVDLSGGHLDPRPRGKHRA